MGRIWWVLAGLACMAIGGVGLWLAQAKFGSTPKGARLERIKQSPHFREGGFRNLVPSPMMTGSRGGLGNLLKFAFNRNPRLRPIDPIPSIKHDLTRLPLDRDFFVWLGHSSYFLQLEGKRFLVDPVLSGRASPVFFTTRAFAGADPYQVEDLPSIDGLVITHDHWDHLDHETMVKLRAKVRRVLCPLGVGAHLERWGYAPDLLWEGDWGDSVDLGAGFTAHVRPTRHFSGRTFRRNQTLWASFVLRTPRGHQVFVGGDGGYGPHFAQIGQEFGGFDLALLENGQYDPGWRYMHMMPEETLQAAVDLHARCVIPVHNSKFSISNHDWDAPLRALAEASRRASIPIVTPLIGDLVDLDHPKASSQAWWLQVR